MSVDGRNLSKVFRAGFDFLGRHTPPRLDESYLQEVAADAEQLLSANDDAFLRDVISIVNIEIGRQLAILAQADADTIPDALKDYFPE